MGFSGYKNIGKCSSSLNTSRFQLWLADESNFCPFSWGESSSVQQREIISFDSMKWVRDDDASECQEYFPFADVFSTW